jgi:hypothetical protein
MGCPTISPISNAFMTEFEKGALSTYRQLHDPPHTLPAPPPTSIILFWFRQADDTMTAIHRHHVTSFLDFLNSIHEKIKWTHETEVNRRIDMLDLTILRQQDGTLHFDVYRKPTHTNQHIAWDSDQPLAHKGATIRALTRRAHHIPTGQQRQEAELSKVHQALRLNGYPAWAIRRYTDHPPHRHTPPPLPTPPKHPSKPPPTLRLLFAKGTGPRSPYHTTEAPPR